MSVKVVNSGAGVISVSVESTPTITVSNPEVDVINVNPLYDAGTPGATGPQGPVGPGIISGGTENQFIQKNSATDYDTKWSAYTLPAADGDEGTVLTTDGAGTVSFAHPQTIAENVKNVSGGILYKGTPVHVTGSVGNLAEVIAADAATNYPAHFVLNEDLNDDEEGLGIALGFINNVDVPDASIYTEGQTVYLGAAGGWVTSKPTGASNAIQNLGIIIKVNTSSDKISGIVMGAGRANDVPNIPTGNIWAGNTSAVATATDTIYVDISSREVGIGTVTPTETLHVVGGCKIEGDFRADAIEINGRPLTSPVNGQYGAGSKLLTQFHTTGSVTAGVVYVAGSSGWTQTDADSGSTSTGLIAVATNSSSPAEMLIEGSVKVSSNAGFLSASKGDVLYLSLNSGELTDDITGHTTGDFVRVCGYVINAATNEVFFSPSKEWTQL